MEKIKSLAWNNSAARFAMPVFALVAGFLAPSTIILAEDTGQLSGVVYYNHNPISNYTDVTPVAYIWDINHTQGFDNVTLDYDNTTGAYTLSNLPSCPLDIILSFIIAEPYDSLPGNYCAMRFLPGGLSALTPQEQADYPITARSTIHQTQPLDNNNLMSGFIKPVFPNHIVFSWDPVPGAHHYLFNINRCTDLDGPNDTTYIDTPVQVTISEATCTADLSDSATDEHYESNIMALNAGGDCIGYYKSTFNGGGYLTNFDFKVLGSVQSNPLNGVFNFANNRISGLVHVTPNIVIQDKTTNEPISDFSLSYDTSNGTYTFDNLPDQPINISGYFVCYDIFDTFPGNFYFSTDADLPNMTPGDQSLFPINTVYLMHLITPKDNFYKDRPIPTIDGTYPVHKPTITFSWDPFFNADKYTIHIEKYRDTNHPLGYGPVEVSSGTDCGDCVPGIIHTTSETSWTVTLEDSAEKEHYHATLRAFNNADQEIGKMAVTYTNGPEFDYRFKVFDSVDLSGVFYYRYLPLKDYTYAPPTLSFYDMAKNQNVAHASLTSYNPTTGQYTIANLPNHPIRITGYFQVKGNSPTLPGNFIISSEADLPNINPDDLASFEIHPVYTMRMTAPWNNSIIGSSPPAAGSYPMLDRRVHIEWGSVPGANSYIVNIDKYRDEEHPDGYGLINNVVNKSINGTAWSIKLLGSEDLEHYRLSISAYDGFNVYLGCMFVTYTNSSSPDYRFKVPKTNLIIDKMKVVAGKTNNTDSFSISGLLPTVEPDDYTLGEPVTIQLGDLAPWTIDTNTPSFKQSGSKPKYSFKGTPGVTPNLNFDLDKATFTISGKNMDLDSLEAPVFISIALGDYTGWVLAQDEGDDDVVNGRKPIPIQFLAGLEDALRVDKVVCKEDGDGRIQKLIVQGGITMADDIDLSLVTGTIYWGNQTFNIPLGGLQAKGAGKFAYIQKTSPNSANISFDLSKCTFKIILTNTTIPWQVSPATLRIVMGTFDAEDDAVF
jgi:hypothetical protein